MENMQIDFPQFCKNLICIPFDKYEKDFTFIVNGKSYYTPRIIADLISPIIRKLHFVDESITEFCININTNNQDDHFSDFLNLCLSSDSNHPKIDSTLYTEYSLYLYKLGNIDESIQLDSKFISSLTTQNCVLRLLTFYNFYIQMSQEFDRQQKNINEIITYISKNFSEIPTENMIKLPIELIEEILSKDTLRITNEDSLLDFLLYSYELDKRYSVLFSKVAFNNVSEKALEKFFDTFCIDDLNTELWQIIWSQLFQKNSNNNQSITNDRYLETNQEEEGILKFIPQKDHEFEGIMRYLTNKTGGNIHLNGTIQITSNSVHYGDYHPWYAVEYESDKFYNSLNDKNIFVCFDFKNRPIQLTSYSIKSYRDGVNYSNLKNWVIEVSNNSKTWETVDWHTNDPTLNGPNITAIFNVKKEMKKFYRYVRLKQTGFSWFECTGHYYVNFMFIEFFGKIKDKNNNLTQKNNFF